MLRKYFIFLLFIFSAALNFSYAEEPIRTTDSWSLEPNDTVEAAAEIVEIVTPEFQSAFFKMLLMLVGIIALLVLTFIIFRKLMHGKMLASNQNNVIKIIEKRALSPKSMLYLVEIGEDTVLVAESHLEVRALHYLEKKQPID